MADPDHQPDSGEDFLSRWSRRKQQVRQEAAAPVAKPLPASEAPPQLPPLESLTKESDFSGFLHPRVDEKLRRAALKKLFSDPHFNVMDGLDVYIDDYSISEPIPAEMMAQLQHAQAILTASDERRREAEAAEKAKISQTEARHPVETAPALEHAPVPPDATAPATPGTPETVAAQAPEKEHKTTG